MKINFADIEEAEDFTPVPDGQYLCELHECEETETSNQDEMWKLRWKILEGDYAGRIIFDNLVFSESAMKRVKLVFSRLGIDVSGELDFDPSIISGKKVLVTVITEDYEAENGVVKKKNSVPFAGYEKYDGASDAAASSGDDASEDKLAF